MTTVMKKGEEVAVALLADQVAVTLVVAMLQQQFMAPMIAQRCGLAQIQG